MEAGILTACRLDELLGGRLRLLFLEVDDGERGAAGLDECAAELVPETTRGAGDDADLYGDETGSVSGARGG